MIKKNKYIININNGSKVRKFNYKYRQTNIDMKINNRGISIEFSGAYNIEPTKYCILSNSILKDAIRKASLLNLIVNAKPLEISKIEIIKNDEIFSFKYNEKLIYCLIDKELNTSFKYNIEIVNKILSYTKSNEKNEVACVYNLLIAKSKNNIYEKFMYLWMAFNSFYNKLSDFDNAKNSQEWQKLKFVDTVFNLGYKGTKNKDLKIKLANIVTNILSKYEKGLHSRETLENNDELCGIIHNEIKNIYNVDIPIYGYLLLDYAYQLRCKYFHGNVPSKLFAYKDENELKAINIVNNLLEEFLDRNYQIIFDKSNERLENI